jgi:poly-beta-1,6-N-acetyl-D-glucosamine N-deacetylase
MVKIIGTTMVLCIVGISLLLSPLNATRDSQFFYENQVAVLMYHHVHDTDTSSSTVTTKLFRDQLQYLHDKGYHFITLTEFRKFMQGSTVPSNAVLVTFDDGYQSFYTNAFPILRDLKVPAVNFIITGDLAKPLETYIPSMSMEQIVDMTHSANNIDAQCHTDSMHSKLPSGKAALVGRVEKDGSLENEEQYKQRILQDTTACRQKLASLYDQPVDSYAYPFGITNKLAASLIAEAGIRYAFTIIPEMATRDSDPLQIPRINAGSPNITPVMLEHTIKRRIVRNIP